MPVVADGFPQSRSEGVLRGGQLEGENELHYLLEVGAPLNYLVDDVLETYDVASDVLLHLGVRLDGDPLVADFSMQFFIN